jgi:two-component system sensor histidine kinase KdpD
VEVARDAARLTIAVADRGPGVRHAERERIFEPFARAEPRPGIAGAGLGLTIARRLAEAQGGAVEYAPREGGGSIFTLSLPAADLSAAAEVPNPA